MASGFSQPVSARQEPPSPAGRCRVTERHYGTTAAGAEVRQFICRNGLGWEMSLISYGATMTSLTVPDRQGELGNVLLSTPDLAAYEACSSYFGSTVGRYCNRIAGGTFELDGTRYTLATNNGPNHLHGGKVGFDRRIWRGEPIVEVNAAGVRFRYVSRDGEEGYPGTVAVVAEYRLTNDRQMVIDLYATTDRATHVNLTNHNYWNLAGSGPILQHRLQIPAEHYLPTDETLIPTGELAPVAETPFDFRTFHEIGERIDPLRPTGAQGYDHCFVLGEPSSPDQLHPAAVLEDPHSGRRMTITTSQPGLQFYSGNFLDGSPASGGYALNNALCLETQHFPNSPNQPQFPSTRLEPNQRYHQRTVHTFSADAP